MAANALARAPYMAGHEVDLYADEWFDELTRRAA